MDWARKFFFTCTADHCQTFFIREVFNFKTVRRGDAALSS